MNQLSLDELSEKFAATAIKWKNRQNSEETITKLLFRISTLENLYEQSEKYENICKVYKNKNLKVKIPKRKLSARIRSLKNLISECNTDPDIVIQPRKIDEEAFNNMFKEIDSILKNKWASFCSYDNRAESLINAASDDASNIKTVEKLKDLTINLKIYSNSIPEKQIEIAAIEKKKNEIISICNKMESEGFDADIRKFLEEVGTSKGFSLNKLIENHKIFDWLKENSRAFSFTVIRK